MTSLGDVHHNMWCILGRHGEQPACCTYRPRKIDCASYKNVKCRLAGRLWPDSNAYPGVYSQADTLVSNPQAVEDDSDDCRQVKQRADPVQHSEGPIQRLHLCGNL